MLWLSTVDQFQTHVCLHPVILMHSAREKVCWVEISPVRARLHSQWEMASIAQVCIAGTVNNTIIQMKSHHFFFSYSSRSLFKWSMWCQCHLCQGRVTHWRLHMYLSVSIHRREWIQLFRYWASSKRIICMWLHALIINCQPVPDPCLSTPCDPNALCVRESLLSGNFNCSCQAPFTEGDGFNCSSMHTGTVNNTVMQMPEAIVNFFSHSSRSLFKWSMWCQCHLCQGRVTHWRLHMYLSVSIHRREWIQLFRYWASSKRIICMWLHALIINCQPVPDPCLSTPCDPNALCVRESLLSGNFSCSCQAPFTVGDGFDCTSTYDGYDIHDLEQVHILCCFHIMQFQTPVLVIPVTSMPLVRGKKYSLIPSPVHAYLHSLKAMASIVQVQYPGLYYYYRKI